MKIAPILTDAIERKLPEICESDAVELRHIRVAVLEHLARYRLSTFSVIQQLPECCELSAADLRRLLKELVHFELLVTAPLYRGLRYWALAPAAADFCGLTANRAGYLSEPAKRNAYAMLLFCCQQDVMRRRLSHDDFPATVLETLVRPGLPTTYYLSTGDVRRIGLARIDAGRTGRWNRIVQTVRNDCERHRKATAWQPFLAADRFEICILTATPQKAERLGVPLREMASHYQIPLHSVALPELIPLLPRVKHTEIFL